MTVAGGTISMLVGAVLLRLTVSGTYERYVRVGMGRWLAIAGVVVILLGLATLAQALRGRGDDAHDHGHEHEHEGVGVGWLLLAPIAALLLVAPPTLGSYGVARGTTVDVRSGAPVFQPLPDAGAPNAMTLLEFSQRAFDHGGVSFNGARVELTGFVADTGETRFQLARYTIACCAADAAPIVVRVAGTAGPAHRDQWVRVTGRFRRTAGDVPELVATDIAEIAAPNDPYE